jgi:hypothetical protein
VDFRGSLLVLETLPGYLELEWKAVVELGSSFSALECIFLTGVSLNSFSKGLVKGVCYGE